MDDLKGETVGYEVAQLTKELDDLACVVCPDLKLRGTGKGLEWKCGNEDLFVRMRIRGNLELVPVWCPRAKALKRELKEIRDK